MPITDADVGITEILGSHRAFRAVLKQTAHDFVVNEVLLSGKVARLTKLAQFPSTEEKSTGKRSHADRDKTDVEESDLAQGGQSKTEISFDEIQSCFDEDQKNEVTKAIIKLIDSGGTELILPVCKEKQKRTVIHGWVRKNLSGYVTDTIESELNGEKGQAIRLRTKSSCRPWKRRRAPRGGKEGSRAVPVDARNDNTYDPREKRYVRRENCSNGENSYVDSKTQVSFVLWKRNKDTLEAINVLARVLRVPPSAFAYAGTKDKRAVTTQLVQIRGVSEARLARANIVLARMDRKFRTVAVGNFEILGNEPARSLNLGDLLGNRFTLALRDLDVRNEDDETNIKLAVDGIRMHGFVNYFGLQRFGTGVSGTHETGFAVLRGNFEDVCRRILLPVSVGDPSVKGKNGITPERKQLVQALQGFARKELSAQKLLQFLPEWMHIERTIAASFANDERRGVKKYDHKAAFSKLPRNLRRIYGHAVQSYLWNMMASERIRMHRPDSHSRMHAIAGDLILGNPDEKEEMNHETEIRTVTDQEERDRSISVFRVLVPVPGSDVSIPDNIKYGNVGRRIIEEQNIEWNSSLVREFGMKGTYRLLLAVPRDIEMKIVSYCNFTDTLIPDALLPRHEKVAGVEQKFARAIETESNPSPAETQSKGDIRIQKEDTECWHPSKEVANATTRSNASANGSAEGTITPAKEVDGDIQRQKKALVIAFTLGRGEFATMLVRELTRNDSSTANQKAMQGGVREKDEAVS